MDIGDQRFDQDGLAMQRGEIQRRLSCAVRGAAHRRQQQGFARDGLHARLRVGRPAVPTPPVVDQRARSGCGLAAVDVLGREAAQAPLVLQFELASVRAPLACDATLLCWRTTTTRRFLLQPRSCKWSSTTCQPWLSGRLQSWRSNCRFTRRCKLAVWRNRSRYGCWRLSHSTKMPSLHAQNGKGRAVSVFASPSRLCPGRAACRPIRPGDVPALSWRAR